MILSDRDIKAALKSGDVVIEPLADDAVQPSSVDVRVGSGFRVFHNHRYPYIDVRASMEDLTEHVEASEDTPFILHPGEFVLATTYEQVSLPEHLVARLEGKSSLGRLGLLIHSSLPGDEPVLFRDADGHVAMRPIEEIVRKQLDGEVVAFDPATLRSAYYPVTGWYEGPPDRIFEVVLASGRRVRVTAGHNLFTLDREGEVQKVRTAELVPGTLVAIPGRVPEPTTRAPQLVLTELAAEDDMDDLVVTGPTVDDLWAREDGQVVEALARRGIGHAAYYRKRGRLPLSVLQECLGSRSPLTARDHVQVRGSSTSLPARFEVDADLAWLLGFFVAEGYQRRTQVAFSNTDENLLDRVETVLHRYGLPTYRAPGSVTCTSMLFAFVVQWLGLARHSREQQLPVGFLGWPDALLAAFLEGFVAGDGSEENTRTSLWTASETLVAELFLLLSRLGRRAGATSRDRGHGPTVQISVPHREHKLGTSIPLPDRLLVRARDELGLAQNEAAALIGFNQRNGLNNLERRSARDAVRRQTLRDIYQAYAAVEAEAASVARLGQITRSDLVWDRVREVRATDQVEPIFDLTVRPQGQPIENFVAGYGGVFVSNTAGFVDAGFSGHLTLELSNVASLPITIYPGMKIGQLGLFQLTSPAERPYGSRELGSKYQGQQGPTASRFFENFGDNDEPA